MKNIPGLRDMLDHAARKALDAERERMAQFVWRSVQVKYCHDQKEWIVTGHENTDDDPRIEVLSTARLKAEAIEEAKLYAFDTSCGPQRAPSIAIYDKRGRLLDAIHKSDVRGKNTV